MAAQGPGADEKHKSEGGGCLVFHFSPSAKPLSHTLAFLLALLLPSTSNDASHDRGLKAPTLAIDKMIFVAVDSDAGEMDWHSHRKRTVSHGATPQLPFPINTWNMCIMCDWRQNPKLMNSCG